MEYISAGLLRYPVRSVDLGQLLSASIAIYRPHAQVVEETELLLRHKSDLSPPSETL
jgi:hypothetical protein